MRIDRIELFHVTMPLIYPWRTAYGEDAEIHSILCRMTSGSVDAWAESCPLLAPCYSPEYAAGLYLTAENWFAPALAGQDLTSGEDLQQRLAHFKGNQFAKGLLDNAWWVLHSRIENRPLHELWGATRTEVEVGDDFGIRDSIDDLVGLIAESVDQKFPRIKLKFRPGWDDTMLAEVRKAFPKQTFHIDCNSGYRLSDLDLFKKIDEFELAMIEQPLAHDDLLDHAELQRQIRTPVCLDESITSVHKTEQAIRIKSCRFVNIKPARVGGLTNALKIHDLCQRENIPCWVGGMLESATGAALCVELAMLDNFTYPADIFPSSRYYREDLATEPLVLSRTADGIPSVKAMHQIPDPDPARLARQTVRSSVILG
ncbi:MAG TPA: o-succinylbenzoate synthase [Planctomycetaceae bacterium]|nr:o-succinylbenzoate synthase [Planctomycetaceae bacterium]